MSKDALSEYIAAIRLRYKNATKTLKCRILDEFCANTDYTRKHAIKLIGGLLPPRGSRPGPKPSYDERVVRHLVKLWELSRRLCSKRLKAALPIWLDYYKAEHFDDEIRMRLLAISPSTIDRLLKPYRAEWRKGLTSTKPGAYLKSQIPIELLDRHATRPGYVEADTVAHCGNSLSGEFANTLTITDLLTGWTENRAMWNKNAETVLDKLKEVRACIPFTILGFACDNGSEFINESLVRYLHEHKNGFIRFTRRRPYHKNDAAHVEQKNDACVRQLIGYQRIDDPALVDLINEIYASYWNPFLNYFCPVMKLQKKLRIGGKLRKFYDTPKTPHDRLRDSGQLTDLQLQRLKTTRSSLNPIELKAGLDRKLDLLFKKLRERSIMKTTPDGRAA